MIGSNEDRKFVVINTDYSLVAIRLRFLFLGIAFGFLFPLLGTLVVCREDGCRDGVMALHMQSPLMQIIDLAPIVLGIFSYALGASVDRRNKSERLTTVAIQEKAALQADAATKLQLQNNALRELNETLESLVYTASHDLKTPVINLESLVIMLKMVKDEPTAAAQVDEIIGRMLDAVKRFRSTIDDLLEVSNLELRESLEIKPVSLVSVFGEVQAACARLVAEEQATLHVALDVDMVQADHHALVTVFQNLIVNAIQYRDAQRNPEIAIQSRVHGDWLEVMVADNGQGIDLDKQRDKIFKMFSRLHSTQSSAGIGLYLVKRMIDKLRGEISIVSQVGVGTTFTIRLPHTSA